MATKSGGEKLQLEQAQVMQVTTKKGSGLDREYKVTLITPESSVLALAALDQEQLYKVTFEVAL